jgi:uncharacterized protein YdbL (DUF1318 family)
MSTLAALALLLLTACVTINIYFPAAAAEQAADRIIEGVWGPGQPSGGKPDAGSPDAQPPAVPPSTPRSEGASLPRLGLASPRSLLHWLVAPAAAGETDFDISTPGIQRLQASMRERHAQLEPFYRSGAVALTNDGLISVREPSVVPLKDRNRVRQLVAEENRDRNALYQEIARANAHPEWDAEIRATFARRWVDKAPNGWWYQTDDGRWRQK